MLGHQPCRAFIQSAFQVLAFAGASALLQGRERADNGHGAAHHVDHAGAGAQRLARRTGHIGETAHELHHLVQGRAVLVGAGKKPLQRAINQPGVQVLDLLIAAAQPLHGAGAVVFEQHVGAGDQLVRHGAA